MDANHIESLKQLYQTKQRSYFDAERPEMLRLVPPHCERLLDVGCGSGSFGSEVKKHFRAETWGIEPDSTAATSASTRLDHVVNATLENAPNLPKHYFDCVSFNDVLEHLISPTDALKTATALLRNDGCIIASIPSISSFPTLWKLIMRGEWTYQERGTLDRTHLRFYTRKSILDLFQSVGLKVVSIEGINPFCQMFPGDRKIWWYYKPLRLLPKQSIYDMRFLQFAVCAVKSSSTTSVPSN